MDATIRTRDGEAAMDSPAGRKLLDKVVRRAGNAVDMNQALADSKRNRKLKDQVKEAAAGGAPVEVTPAGKVHLLPQGHKEKLAHDLQRFGEHKKAITKAEANDASLEERTRIRVAMLRDAVPLLEQYLDLINDLKGSVADVFDRLKEDGQWAPVAVKFLIKRRADEGASEQLRLLLDDTTHMEKLMQGDLSHATRVQIERKF